MEPQLPDLKRLCKRPPNDGQPNTGSPPLHGALIYTFVETAVGTKVIYIDEIFVAENRRRCGIATKLLESLINPCDEHWIKTDSIHLLVLEKEEGAVALYKKFGFKPLDDDERERLGVLKGRCALVPKSGQCYMRAEKQDFVKAVLCEKETYINVEGPIHGRLGVQIYIDKLKLLLTNEQINLLVAKKGLPNPSIYLARSDGAPPLRE